MSLSAIEFMLQGCHSKMCNETEDGTCINIRNVISHDGHHLELGATVNNENHIYAIDGVVCEPGADVRIGNPSLLNLNTLIGNLESHCQTTIYKPTYGDMEITCLIASDGSTIDFR